MTPPGTDPTTGSGTFAATTLHPGEAVGPVLRLDEPLSFWGGTDETGRIVDVHHPQHGRVITGTVLVMPAVRGSSSSAAVLAEQIRTGRAPAAIVLCDHDTILVAGALVAAELYAVRMPVVTVASSALPTLAGGTARVLAEDQTATIEIQGGL